MSLLASTCERRTQKRQIGHSAGGAAVLAMAAEVPEVRAVVVLGTPAEGAEQRERIATLRRALLVVHSPDDESHAPGK